MDADAPLISAVRDALLRSWGQQPGLLEPGYREADKAARDFVAMQQAYETAKGE